MFFVWLRFLIAFLTKLVPAYPFETIFGTNQDFFAEKGRLLAGFCGLRRRWIIDGKKRDEDVRYKRRQY